MSRILKALGERVLLCDGAFGSRIQAMDLDVERDYQGAENCTELAQVWRDGDQADQGFRDKVVARIADLKDDLLARGAQTEALACGLFLSQAQDPEDFFMEGDPG